MTNKKPVRLPIPGNTVLPLVFTLALQGLVYFGSKLLMAGAYHHNLETAWDLAIPFLPWTVSIYVGTFLYWAISFLLILRSGTENAFRFLCAHCMSLLIALVFFLLLPTTNTRPQIEGGGLWNFGMRLIYALDTPDNLFPSLHCELSWLCFQGLKKVENVPTGGKRLALIFSLLIFVSTLTTKQHILLDVFGGWLIAEISFRLCGSKKVTTPFYKVFNR
ncbi:MAG: phosphatase PAP2 family protein [Candidatus Faecousia sp.]|nr:phosphatase PAP2 family protein [Candidatus Faecousia sp.]